jgi:Flp pilus assembly protein CpaB
MNSRTMTVAVAFLLAATATLAVFLYVRGIENDRQSSGDVVQVIVSDRDIPAGTDLDDLIEDGAFSEIEVTEDSLIEGAITNLSELQGQETSAPVLTGEQIAAARLRGVGVLPGGALGIPEGHQALALNLEIPRLAGGDLRGGDHVTIYATFDKGANGQPMTVTLVPDALVLETKGLTDEAGIASGAGEGVVVLALTPRDAAKVAFSKEQGQLWFALLAPGEKGTNSGVVTVGEVTR